MPVKKKSQDLNAKHLSNSKMILKALTVLTTSMEAEGFNAICINRF